jgi:hypothetical protein
MSKTQLENCGIVDGGALLLKLNPPIDNKGILIHLPSKPHKDVQVSFVDQEGKYILARKYNERQHWGDCEIPVEFEYVILNATPAEKESNEKINVSSKPGLFKRDSKG